MTVQSDKSKDIFVSVAKFESHCDRRPCHKNRIIQFTMSFLRDVLSLFQQEHNLPIAITLDLILPYAGPSSLEFIQELKHYGHQQQTYENRCQQNDKKSDSFVRRLFMFKTITKVRYADGLPRDILRQKADEENGWKDDEFIDRAVTKLYIREHPIRQWLPVERFIMYNDVDFHPAFGDMLCLPQENKSFYWIDKRFVCYSKKVLFVADRTLSFRCSCRPHRETKMECTHIRHSKRL